MKGSPTSYNLVSLGLATVRQRAREGDASVASTPYLLIVEVGDDAVFQLRAHGYLRHRLKDLKETMGHMELALIFVR